MTTRSWLERAARREPRRQALRLLVKGALIVAGLGVGAARAEPAPAPEFLVIVHPSNPSTSVEREFVAAAFLKRTTRWGDGEAIHPVDQRPNAACRRSFSSQVIRRSVEAVRNYWQQRIFSGRGVPPPEVDTDQASVDYVVSYPGAIGYVSPKAKLGAAKVLLVR